MVSSGLSCDASESGNTPPAKEVSRRSSTTAREKDLVNKSTTCSQKKRTNLLVRTNRHEQTKKKKGPIRIGYWGLMNEIEVHVRADERFDVAELQDMYMRW